MPGKWTAEGLLRCENCDEPASKQLNDQGLRMCCGCAFGQFAELQEQLEDGDVVRREEKVVGNG